MRFRFVTLPDIHDLNLDRAVITASAARAQRLGRPTPRRSTCFIPEPAPGYSTSTGGGEVRLGSENRIRPPDGTATMAVRPASVRQFGSNTLSITWITP